MNVRIPKKIDDQALKDAVVQTLFCKLDYSLESLNTQLKRQQTAFQGISPETLFAQTSPAAHALLATNPTALSLDATPDASVFFTADYAEKGRVYLEIFFSGEQPEPIEAVVNIYALDNRCILAYAGTLVETIQKIAS